MTWDTRLQLLFNSNSAAEQHELVNSSFVTDFYQFKLLRVTNFIVLCLTPFFPPFLLLSLFPSYLLCGNFAITPPLHTRLLFLPITTHSVQSRSMGQVTHLWKVILCTGHSWTVWSQCNSKLLIEHIFLLYLTSWGWGWVQLKKSIEYWVDNHLWLEGSKKDPL